MIVSELMGGMGNQMFQYALGRHLAINNKTELLLDTKFLLDRTPKKDFVYRNYDLGIFNIDEKFTPPEISNKYGLCKTFTNKLLNKLIKPKMLTCVFEGDFRFKPEILNTLDNAYLNGYWQTEFYFKAIESIIRKDFTFKETMGFKASELAQKIKNTNAVCLNVRRGDFVNNPTHGTLGMDYYGMAEKILIEHGVVNPVVFIFSDEIEWCKEHIKLSSETCYVGHEYAGDKFRDYMELMMLCKHFIIPNSSFAWWAAWLSNNAGKKVIAPKNWFPNAKWQTDDLLPSNWIKI